VFQNIDFFVLPNSKKGYRRAADSPIVKSSTSKELF